eukprot:305450_1
MNEVEPNIPIYFPPIEPSPALNKANRLNDQETKELNMRMDAHMNRKYDKYKAIEHIINHWFKNDYFTLNDKNLFKIIFEYYNYFILFYFQRYYTNDEEMYPNDAEHEIIKVYSNGHVYSTQVPSARIVNTVPINEALDVISDTLFMKQTIKISGKQMDRFIAYLLYIQCFHIECMIIGQDCEEEWSVFRYNSEMIGVFNILHGMNEKTDTLKENELAHVFKKLFGFIKNDIKLNLQTFEPNNVASIFLGERYWEYSWNKQSKCIRL